MQKLIATHLNTFDTRIKVILENFIKEVLEETDANKVRALSIGVNRNTLELCSSETTLSADALTLVNCACTKLSLISQDANNSKLYEALTKEEKNAYLLRQQFYISNNDFIYFNIDNMLFDYCQSMFKQSFNKYAKLKIAETIETLLSIDSFKDARKKFASIVKIAVSDDEVLIRAKKEYEELTDRIEKLDKFMSTEKFTKLNACQRRLLPLQLDYMKSYSYILESRIDNWFNEDEENA